jgi:hypothetical protein
MSWMRTKWTPHEAEEWTREDWIAIVLSPLSYILITFGLAMSLFLLPAGFILLALGIIATAVMFRVIGPKLRVISHEYEERQREYLTELEQIQRWEDKP